MLWLVRRMEISMNRLDKILENSLFKDCIEKNKLAEVHRRFCHHDIEHFFAVARIAMLLNLQENLQIEKDILYAAAFLHDIGRFLQYKENIPHEEASVDLAWKILPKCDFSTEEIEMITGAISSHRGSVEKDRVGILADVLYRADKMSRNCKFCDAYEECNWPDEKKQQEVRW